MECTFCSGPAHPATGAQYTHSVIACGPCVRMFWRWVRERQWRRWSGSCFSDHIRSPER